MPLKKISLKHIWQVGMGATPSISECAGSCLIPKSTQAFQAGIQSGVYQQVHLTHVAFPTLWAPASLLFFSPPSLLSSTNIMNFCTQSGSKVHVYIKDIMLVSIIHDNMRFERKQKKHLGHFQDCQIMLSIYIMP